MATRTRSMFLAALSLSLALAGCGGGDQVVVEGVDAKTGKPLDDRAAQVQDLGAGQSNEGEPDMEADLHEAAIDQEDNMGPNAPGYIP